MSGIYPHGWRAALRANPPAWAVIDNEGVCHDLHPHRGDGTRTPATEAAVAQVEEGRPQMRRESGIAYAADELTAEDWIADTLAALPPDPTRQEQHRAMLNAYLDGHPAVTLSPRGQPHWSVAAPMRREIAPGDARPCRLAHAPATAAQEMATNLGDRTWLDRAATAAENEREARRARLAALATALFGPEWQAPTSRALAVDLRTIQRYASGARGDAPRAEMIDELRHMIPARRAELRQWLATLDGEAPGR